MLKTNGFKTTTNLENKKDGGSEINNEVTGNNNRSLCKSVEVKKNTSPRKKFFTPEARLVFTQLKQVFSNIPILYHFLPERYIHVETDVFGCTINEIFS